METLIWRFLLHIALWGREIELWKPSYFVLIEAGGCSNQYRQRKGYFIQGDWSCFSISMPWLYCAGGKLEYRHAVTISLAPNQMTAKGDLYTNLEAVYAYLPQPIEGEIFLEVTKSPFKANCNGTVVYPGIEKICFEWIDDAYKIGNICD